MYELGQDIGPMTRLLLDDVELEGGHGVVPGRTLVSG
jgi:hypothetical protein